MDTNLTTDYEAPYGDDHDVSTAYVYEKQNDEPILIDYVAVDDDGEPVLAFWYGNEYHLLGDFVRTHNNPWVYDDYPDYIHGYDAFDYVNPLYVEIVGGDAVNVYVCRRA